MAVIWAKSAGNWTDASLWAFWNETTQQIEDYGQVPQTNDTVYANGYNININNANNLTVKTLTNGDLDFTGFGGGSFVRTNSNIFTINATIEVWERSNCVYNSGNVNTTWVINGDIIAKERLQNYFGLVAHNGSTSQPAIINGNLIGNNLINVSVQYGNYSLIISPLTINGNVINEYDLPAISYTNTNNEQLTINGNVNGYLATWQNRGVEISNIIINGNVDSDQKGFFTTHNAASYYTIDIFVTGVLRFDSKFHCRNLKITKIEYRTIPFLMDIENLYCDDPATFECRYIGAEPNPNPYIIINPNTIAQTYPPENKVLAPTQYGAQMELEGTYTPDYPQQAEVLNDVEYARYEVATNNLALYSNTLYLYDGSSWSTIPYLGETTTNITDATHSVDPDVDIDGVTTTATEGDIVKYGAYYYMWDDANTIWIKTDYYYIGETNTDISGGSTRNQLFIVGESIKGTLQIPTSPSTLDIVTAIKNDSDLGGKIASTDTNVSDVKSRLGSVNSGTIGSVVDTINTNTQSLSTDLAVVDGNVDTLIARITQNLVDRLGSSVTVQLLQQVLDAHLND